MDGNYSEPKCKIHVIIYKIFSANKAGLKKSKTKWNLLNPDAGPGEAGKNDKILEVTRFNYF